MGILERINSPADLKRLDRRELRTLAAEIRMFLVESVSATGGHLGPNLGVVELSVALHRVFDSPRDAVVWDVGHQAYVHKLLTGRRDFSGLRQRGGISGYPARSESIHDILENSHASAGLSWADGIASARSLLDGDGHVVAIIGDGALTGGMAWEAINNIAAREHRQVIIVINDNGRSYDPTIGGLASHLDRLRTMSTYEAFFHWGKTQLTRLGRPGRLAYDALRGFKRGLKDVFMPQAMFVDLGIKYLGPIDGHDLDALERALQTAKGYPGPIIVHTITEKGRGYLPAEADVRDHFHAVGKIHPETGLPVEPSRFEWTAVFADELLAIGKANERVVAITAAMLEPVGFAPFAKNFPERVFDVGIAELHAGAAAAAMSFAGMHPVVAMYATFLNRAFDSVLMDVALHKQGVTFVLDRAGVTGSDGASHNGQWDMALMRLVPGLHLAAPRDEASLRAALRTAVDIVDAPSVVRYPKGPIPEPILAIATCGQVDVIARHNAGDGAKSILIVGIGAMAPTAMDTAEKLASYSYQVEVVAPTWVLPVPAELVDMAGRYDFVATIEDGLADSGIGSLLAARAVTAGITTPVRTFGLPTQFFAHGTRQEVLRDTELEPSAIADGIHAAVVAMTMADTPS